MSGSLDPPHLIGLSRLSHFSEFLPYTYSLLDLDLSCAHTRNLNTARTCWECFKEILIQASVTKIRDEVAPIDDERDELEGKSVVDFY